MIFDLIPLFLILLIFPVAIDYPWNFVSLLVGILVVPALYLYNKAMMLEEASRVGSLTYIYPIFVTIIGFAFLGERLGALKYAGIFALVAGTILISYKKSRKKIVISPALLLLLIYSVLWAVESVLSDYTLNFFDFLSLYAWSLVGSFLGGMLMLLPDKARKTFCSDIKKCGNRTILYILLTSVVFYVGDLSFVIALSLGSVSLTSALSSAQPLFTLIFAYFISIFRPAILKEYTDKYTVLLKIAAIILIFAGTYMVAFV